MNASNKSIMNVPTHVYRYHPTELSITENGYNVRGESYMTMDEKLNDSKRVKYFKEYIQAATEAAVYDGVRTILSNPMHLQATMNCLSQNLIRGNDIHLARYPSCVST